MYYKITILRSLYATSKITLKNNICNNGKMLMVEKKQTNFSMVMLYVIVYLKKKLRNKISTHSSDITC